MAAHTTRIRATAPPLPHLRLPRPLRSGPVFVVMLLLDVPLAAVGMASTGLAQLENSLFAGAWFALVTTALYQSWARFLLPFVGTTFLAIVIVTLPFNSLAFVLDFWT